jgi:glycerol-3-phosphate O-acyltransferase
MAWLLRRILALWVRFTVLPADALARLQGRAHPVCYVLEHRATSDLALLQSACVRLRLPRPRKRLLERSDLRSVFHLGGRAFGGRIV